MLGTESGRVLILNPAGTGIVKNIWLGVTPAFMAVQVRVRYRWGGISDSVKNIWLRGS